MSKLSSASIRLVQKLNRKNKNGEFPIYIVVCFHGRVEQATGISCLEHFLGFSSDGYVYPVIGDAEGDAIQRRVKKYGNIAIKWVREAFKEINGETIRSNVSNGLEEPLVDIQKVVLYTARHSFCSAYLNSPGATVRGAASLLSRSANTISVYIHSLQHDKEIADAVSFLYDK